MNGGIGFEIFVSKIKKVSKKALFLDKDKERNREEIHWGPSGDW